MYKLGKIMTECDKKYCGKCDTCLYDDNSNLGFRNYLREKESKPIIPTTTNIYTSRDGSKIDCCNDCRHSRKSAFRQDSDYATWSCSKCKELGFTSAKTIKYMADAKEKIDIPNWCPLLESTKKRMLDPKMSSEYERREYWKTVVIKETTLPDIKVKHWYHIPPIAGGKRKDIYVVGKHSYSIEYTYDGSNEDKNYMFDTDVEFRFLKENINPLYKNGNK
jgi:hypothetical protein